MARSLDLDLLPDRLAVARLDPTAAVPDWLAGSRFSSVTRTPEELSVVCADASIPRGVRAERGFRCLVVRGPLAFSETGILEAIARPLAQAGVSLFALSTHDTDYVLVPGLELEDAIDALTQAGHRVHR